MKSGVFDWISEVRNSSDFSENLHLIPREAILPQLETKLNNLSILTTGKSSEVIFLAKPDTFRRVGHELRLRENRLEPFTFSMPIGEYSRLYSSPKAKRGEVEVHVALRGFAMPRVIDLSDMTLREKRICISWLEWLEHGMESGKSFEEVVHMARKRLELF